MLWSRVVPAPPLRSGDRTPKDHGVTAALPRSVASIPLPLVLKDATVKPLPTIDTTRTLAAKLCGRVDDAAFNARVIALTQRLDPLAHVAGVVVFICGVAQALVHDPTGRTVLTYATAVASGYLSSHVAASLSYDMLLLVVQTFEFWFLSVVNITNVWLWMTIFHDVRAVAFAWLGVNFAMTLVTDANLYTRRFFIRETVVAAPSLLVVIVATILHLPPAIQYPTYRVWGLTIDAVDLLVNGNLIMAYFTAIRAYRCHHLVFSRTIAIDRIECDMYFPICHLVVQTGGHNSSVTSRVIRTSTLAPATPLELIQHASTRGIDTAKRLLPWVAGWTDHDPVIGLAVGVGCVGGTTCVVGFVTLTVSMDDWTALPTTSSACALEITAFTCSLLFCLVVAAHWQPVLVKRVCCEIDAWFVVFQLSVVSLGACDLLRWAPRPTLLILTASLWCLWILFLDAVPATTRRRLRLSRWFVVLVIVCLDGFPLILSYWLYFSPAHELIHDRELLHLRVGSKVVRASLLGFVSSKLATLWIWMGRFLWRELFRPTDAFKLIKRRVFYRVRPVSLEDS